MSLWRMRLWMGWDCGEIRGYLYMQVLLVVTWVWFFVLDREKQEDEEDNEVL